MLGKLRSLYRMSGFGTRRLSGRVRPTVMENEGGADNSEYTEEAGCAAQVLSAAVKEASRVSSNDLRRDSVCRADRDGERPGAGGRPAPNYDTAASRGRNGPVAAFAHAP